MNFFEAVRSMDEGKVVKDEDGVFYKKGTDSNNPLLESHDGLKWSPVNEFRYGTIQNGWSLVDNVNIPS